MSPLDTVDNADAYFVTRLHSSAWTSASSDDKLAALMGATRIMNLFAYQGTKTITTQDNEWPRNYCGKTNWTPTEILIALYEIAYALIDGVDVERELRSIHVTSRGYSAVRTTYDTGRIPEHILVGVPSALAWAYLSSFLQKSGTIKLSRVS